MRNAMLGLMIIPGLVGVNVLGRSARVADAAPPSHSHAVFAAQVAQAMTGTFRASALATSDGVRPALDRRACKVNAPGLGANVLYVEDSFVGRPGHPVAQRLVAVEAHRDGAVVREFTPIDPESVVGLCDAAPVSTVYRANTVEREGCEITLRRGGAVVEGATVGHRCASRINDARFVERSLRIGDDGVDFSERGVDASGRVVWGGARAALRFMRR